MEDAAAEFDSSNDTPPTAPTTARPPARPQLLQGAAEADDDVFYLFLQKQKVTQRYVW
jgi:hypothetical protein